MFGLSAVTILCLIGLIMEPSGDWDLMPYAAYPGPLSVALSCIMWGIGSMIVMGLASYDEVLDWVWDS